MNYMSDIGLTVTNLGSHGNLHYSSMGNNCIYPKLTLKKIFLLGLVTTGKFLLKLFTCILSMCLMLYGYFYFVSSYGLDSFTILHIMAGILIAELTTVIWVLITDILE